MTRTYIENQLLPHVPEEYSEDNLRKKLLKHQNELRNKIDKYAKYQEELEVFNAENDWNLQMWERNNEYNSLRFLA